MFEVPNEFASKMSDAPLPTGWQQKISQSRGCIYYFNEHTGESSWVRPSGPADETPAEHGNGRARPGPADETPAEQGNGRAQSDAEEAPPLAIFNGWRQRLLQDGHYLDIVALDEALRRHFRGRLPKEVGDGLGGLERMLTSVNSALMAAFATHHMLTLRDLEAWVLRSTRDFEGVASFAQLCLGPLSLHPLVKRHIPHAHDVLTRHPRLRDMDTVDLTCRVGEILAASSSRDANFSTALQLFAQELGLANASELPIFSRGESFVGSLISRCLKSRRDAEHEVERQAKREAADAARRAMREMPPAQERPSRCEQVASVNTRCEQERPSRWGAPPTGGLSTAGAAATGSAQEFVDQLLDLAEHASAHALRDPPRGAAADPRAALFASVDAARGAPDAATAVRMLLAELRAAWSDDAVLGWALPRFASLKLSVPDAKQLILSHCTPGHGRSTLTFPPVFNNVERMNLHELCRRFVKQVETGSQGDGVYRALTVERREMDAQAAPPLTLDQIAQTAMAGVRALENIAAQTEGETDTGVAQTEGETEIGAAADGKLCRPSKAWLKSGARPKAPPNLPHKSAPMPTSLAAALIGKELVAPLVTKLAYAGANATRRAWRPLRPRVPQPSPTPSADRYSPPQLAASLSIRARRRRPPKDWQRRSLVS